ncbi:MAG: gliding motility-associated C-terminal domain-containing protein [Bacteroidia bacterium]
MMRASLILFFSLWFIKISYSQNLESAQQMTAKEPNFSSFANNTPTKDLHLWKLFNSPEYYKHPEFGILTDDSPCDDCIELLDRRTSTTRYFVDRNDTSHFYLQQANMPLHYSKQDFFVSISSKLEETDNGLIESKNKLNKIAFNIHDYFTTMQCGNDILHFNDLSLFIEKEESVILTEQANWSDYKAGDDGVFIKNIFQGIDAEFRVFQGAIKSNYILNENKFGEFDALLIRDNLQISSENISLSFDEYQNVKRGFGNVIISTKSNSLATYNPAYAYPKDGGKQEMRTLEYVIDTSSITIVVPYELINQYDGQTPLIIDPLVTANSTLAQAAISGSQFNATCDFVNSCNYTQAVSFPANSTYTDILWSFNYQAIGACWREDGALRVQTGNCISPNQAGFFWFCNLPTAGLCNGDNISIFNDLSTCLPSPSCLDQQSDFVLQFFRSCFGAAGCNNNCIAAFSAWTITVEGFTVEPQNLSNPITLSSGLVCEDENFTASVQGNFGVPPYSYNWSLSPTGNPSEGNTASVSISIPSSGNYTIYQTLTDACNNEVESTDQVIVIPSPEPIITGSTSYCEGESLILNTGSFSTYSWSNGGNSISSSVVESDNPITVTVTNGIGCSGTSDEFFVTEGTNIFYTNTIDICEGESITIHGNQESTAGIYEQTFNSNGCDSVATITLVVNQIPNVTASATEENICSGDETQISASGADQYTWDNGLGNGQNQTVSPLSTTTYIVTGSNPGGCENTAQITIDVQEGIFSSTENITICDDESYTLPDGNVADVTGTYESNFQSISGCDSLIITELVVNPNYLINQNISLCDSESYTLPNGDIVNISGDYQIVLQAVGACDSTINTIVEFNFSSNLQLDESICEGQTYPMPDGSEASNSGLYEFDFQTEAGCDSTITINLTVQESFINEINPAICDNQTYTLPDGTLVDNAGQYEVTTSGVACDTINIINLEVNPNYEIFNNNSICDTESFLLPDGSSVQSSGIYNITFTSIQGCDSVYVIDLEVLPSFESTQEVSICPGDNYALNDGTIVTEPGVYPQVFASANSCDSTVIINLQYFPAYNFELNLQLCEEDNPLDPFGQPIESSGEYLYELTSIQGCDSIVQLNISLGSGSFQSEAIEICEGDTFITIGGQRITQEGKYDEVYPNVFGCDSIVEYVISLLPTPQVEIVATPPSGEYYKSPTLFQNESIEADSIEWDFGEFGLFTDDNPVIDFNDVPGIYNVCLNAWNDNGCRSSTCIDYVIEALATVYIPSAFTPNGDGLNDFFYVKGENIDPENYQLEIFNRWGELLFASKDPLAEWDGSVSNTSILPGDDVFVYRVQLSWTNSFGVSEYQGTVTMIK